MGAISLILYTSLPLTTSSLSITADKAFRGRRLGNGRIKTPYYIVMVFYTGKCGAYNSKQ